MISLMELGALGGIILCAAVLIYILASGIAEHARIRMEREEEDRYRARWARWGDTTDLSA